MQEFRFADYFERKVLQKRPYIRKDWCIAAVPDLGGRYLRVITLADKVTILNAFPDKGFKP